MLTKLRAAVIAVADFVSLCYKPDGTDNIRVYLDVIRLRSGSAADCYLQLCGVAIIILHVFVPCGVCSNTGNPTTRKNQD